MVPIRMGDYAGAGTMAIKTWLSLLEHDYAESMLEFIKEFKPKSFI